ncbi:hypothetical protein BABINDRAFT_165205 [Babjeviella inositovora NRRL Y-12698]|uniref:Myb-like domain-containing protein n=1 Tax=Babjeviella inositovora NRRL Y-12698 TaxID=984486 RepID=A0A1E3QVM7_9ASCO|nr:uncharacterized protein BABINDRAFT_165205 [Babjeviella inositovora NRRL Y-12698]ODQ81674.1 hypothetical protein BABINDRAFT_165205 [Babjeviella inositovora NRRL Y-12698]
MSSIVKKGTRFTPKVSQRRTPRKEDPVSEPPSQISGAEPPASPLLKTDIFKSTEVQTTSVVFTEKYSQSQTAIPGFDNEDNDGEIEQLKKPPVADFRRRRMSSIKVSTPISFKSRQGSVSGASALKESVEPVVPVLISVPLLAPSKRTKRPRNLLSGGDKMAMLKRSNATRKPEPRDEKVETEEQPQIDATKRRKSKSPAESGSAPHALSGVEIADGESIFIINPTTNKMAKINQAKLSQLKLGPVLSGVDVFSKVIRDMSQIPNGISEEDPKLLEEYTVDEDSISMSDLCKPSIPIGAVSSNFDLTKEARRRIQSQKLKEREQRAQARRDRISLDKFIKDEEDKNREARIAVQKELMNVDQEEARGHSVIQLTLQNGELNIDEDSLVVDRHQRDNTNNLREKEEQNRFENPVNSRTYGKARYTDKWTDDEMKQFYNALSAWGTDFTVIAQLFPYRTRRQVKARFTAEERKHPYIIELALARKLPQDFGNYIETSNRKTQDFPSLLDFNAKLEDLKKLHREELENIELGKQKAKLEDAEVQRRREIEIRTGTRTMSRAEKIKELRQNETVVGTVDDVKKKRELELAIPEEA